MICTVILLSSDISGITTFQVFSQAPFHFRQPDGLQKVPLSFVFLTPTKSKQPRQPLSFSCAYS
jgi:hypothetical protein